MTELTQGIGRGNIATAAVCEAPSEGVPELGGEACRLGESIDHCLYLTTYIKAKSKGAHYNINTKENLQNLVIEREPKKFTNRDGKEIVYHDIRNYDTYSLVKEIESRLKTNYQQFIKECGL